MIIKKCVSLYDTIDLTKDKTWEEKRTKCKIGFVFMDQSP